MNITVQTSGLRLGAGQLARLRSFCVEKIGSALLLVRRPVVHVAVFLKDVNGPRAGVDKECIVKIDVAGNPPAIARGRNENLFALVGQVSERASRAALKRVKRGTTRRDRLSVRGAPPSPVDTEEAT